LYAKNRVPEGRAWFFVLRSSLGTTPNTKRESPVLEIVLRSSCLVLG